MSATGVPFAECSFCGVAVAMAGGIPALAPAAPSAAKPLGADVTNARTRFVKAVVDGLTSGGDAFTVLRDAAAERLGVIGQSDAVARVTLAMADDFEQQSGASIRKDGQALSRMAEAYLIAIVELRSMQEAHINLPFLTANDQGPKHFELRVTPAVIAALAARDPGQPPRAVSPLAAAPSPEPLPKKRGWWPF